MHQMINDPFVVVIPLALLIGTVLAGLLLRRLLFAAVKRWARNTDSHLDVLFINTLRRPIMPSFHAAWSLGGLAATVSLSMSPPEIRTAAQCRSYAMALISKATCAGSKTGRELRCPGKKPVS